MSLLQVLKALCPAIRQGKYMRVPRADLAEKNLKFYYHPDNPGQGWKVYSVHPGED